MERPVDNEQEEQKIGDVEMEEDNICIVEDDADHLQGFQNDDDQGGHLKIAGARSPSISSPIARAQDIPNPAASMNGNQINTTGSLGQ